MGHFKRVSETDKLASLLRAEIRRCDISALASPRDGIICAISNRAPGTDLRFRSLTSGKGA